MTTPDFSDSSLFSQFLLEANAAGSKFEKKVTRAVNKWLEASKLDSKFKASRFQKIHEDEVLDEDDGNRDEDYSDVVIEDLKSGDKFFVECKQNIKDNVVTTMFDISEELTLVPVVGYDRTQSDDELLLTLAQRLQETDGFQKFKNFLREETDWVRGGFSPADFYFNKQEINERDLQDLIKSYNKMVKNGEVEADNKKFDGKLIRESTRNMLAVGLMWRLYDRRNTWDICCAEDLDFFGQLVRKHYLEDKEIPAKYLQFGDDLFIANPDDNPLNIDCDSLPEQMSGKFYLKFTPRFGTGSMYITPRSSITDELQSNSSFLSEDKWPKVQ